MFLSSSKYQLIFYAALFITGTGCATIANFDQYAYTQTTSLKVDALNVMGQATEPYQAHQADVAKVQMALDKLFEYEKNRPQNAVSEKMWAVVRDSSGYLFGGFIKKWEKENTLPPTFIKEAQQLVGQSFDQISQLESGKIKAVPTTIK